MAHAQVHYVDNPIETVVLTLTGDEAQRLNDLLSHVRLGASDVGGHFYSIGDALEKAGLEFNDVDAVLTENGIELVER